MQAASDSSVSSDSVDIVSDDEDDPGNPPELADNAPRRGNIYVSSFRRPSMNRSSPPAILDNDSVMGDVDANEDAASGSQSFRTGAAQQVSRQDSILEAANRSATSRESSQNPKKSFGKPPQFAGKHS